MKRLTTSVIAVALLACSLAALAAEEKPELASEKDEGVDQAVAAQLARRLPEINFAGQGLADVVDFLRDVSGANIVVNWRALEAAGINKDAPVTGKLKDVRFDKGLQAALDSVGTAKGKAAHWVDHGLIVISAAPDPKRPAPKMTVTGLPFRLNPTLPEVNFAGQGFEDVTDFLRDVSGVKIKVDWDALKKAGVAKDTPVSMRVRDMKFMTVLRYLMEAVSDGKTPMQATYADGVLTITTGPVVAAEPKPEKKPEK